MPPRTPSRPRRRTRAPTRSLTHLRRMRPSVPGRLRLRRLKRTMWLRLLTRWQLLRRRRLTRKRRRLWPRKSRPMPSCMPAMSGTIIRLTSTPTRKGKPWKLRRVRRRQLLDWHATQPTMPRPRRRRPLGSLVPTIASQWRRRTLPTRPKQRLRRPKQPTTWRSLLGRPRKLRAIRKPPRLNRATRKCTWRRQASSWITRKPRKSMRKAGKRSGSRASLGSSEAGLPEQRRVRALRPMRPATLRMTQKDLP